MDLISLFLGLLLGAVLAGAVAWILASSRVSARSSRARQEGEIEQATLKEQIRARTDEAADLRTRLGEERAKLAEKEEALRQETARKSELKPLAERAEHLEAENQKLQDRLQEGGARIAELETALKGAREQAEKDIALLKDAENNLKMTFQNVANKILEEHSQKFTEQSKTNLGALVNPLSERIKEFSEQVRQAYGSELQDRASLRTEIKLLKDLNERISAEAVNLTKALKGESKTRGTWGELILERILEMSGLRKGHEFETQVSLQSEDARRLQPDVIVHLPDGKDLVIDSKVSLNAYERYYNAESDEERRAALQAHLASVRAHFQGLSAKDYGSLRGVRTLDFVLMFMPIEGAFMLALENDASLFQESFEKHVLIVCPSTLLATLRTIHNIWRYENQSRNAQEIARQAGNLYDAFVRFIEDLERVGAKLTEAQESCESAHKRLTTGRGNLVRRSLQLRKLGVKAKTDLPGDLLSLADDDAEEPEEESAEPREEPDPAAT
ncbi:MAG TPA: DNA recombination protein RmuC [Sumerlaeia bacterium]|nr:DNA recombination protein RmuC [Sumerlaeia bacterium]